jgi:hypothetical protein
VGDCVFYTTVYEALKFITFRAVLYVRVRVLPQHKYCAYYSTIDWGLVEDNLHVQVVSSGQLCFQLKYK